MTEPDHLDLWEQRSRTTLDPDDHPEPKPCPPWFVALSYVLGAALAVAFFAVKLGILIALGAWIARHVLHAL